MSKTATVREADQLIGRFSVETALNDFWIKEDARVEAGEGEDHDTGRVVSVDGDMAIVAWDSGVKTLCLVEDLRKIEDE